MTTSNEVDYATYPGAGSTGPFSYLFKIYSSDQLLVFKVNDATRAVTLLALTSGYTIAAGSVGSDSGSITLTSALAVGYTLWIYRNLAFIQGAVFRSQADFDAAKNEDCMDKSVMRDLQLKRRIDRSLQIPLGADPADYSLEITPEANTVIGFDANSNATTYGTTDISTVPLSNTAALALGVAAAGTDTKASRSDHVHPTTGIALSDTVVSVTAPITGGGTLAANFSIGVSEATTSNTGVVTLAADKGTDANTVVQGSDSRLVRKYVFCSPSVLTTNATDNSYIPWLPCDGMPIDTLAGMLKVVPGADSVVATFYIGSMANATVTATLGTVTFPTNTAFNTTAINTTNTTTGQFIKMAVTSVDTNTVASDLTGWVTHS